MIVTHNGRSLVSSSIDQSASAITTATSPSSYMMSAKAKAEWHDFHARSRIGSEDDNGLVGCSGGARGWD
jgi:hypothetical protein